MGIIRRCLPRPMWSAAFAVLRFARRSAQIGFARYCPVCRAHVRAFRPYGVSSRPDACCPVCGSLERLRFVWLVLDAHPELLAGPDPRVLHVAPEPMLSERLANLPGVEYISADLDPSRAMVRMDVQRIQYPDDTFDFIYCSHVLEHVPDDRMAVSEFHRVLKPGRTAMIIVPINVEQTFEDPSVTDPAERLRLFGQDDHVRKYGPDVVDRLRDAGFKVQTVAASDVADEKTARRMGLKRDILFLCKKPTA
jgi:SAM-dependent methyltransferase